MNYGLRVTQKNLKTFSLSQIDKVLNWKYIANYKNRGNTTIVHGSLWKYVQEGFVKTHKCFEKLTFKTVNTLEYNQSCFRQTTR